MKRSVVAAVILAACALCAQAETIKLKSGRFVSGSILSQTEYTLNLATSYGNITISQRDIEQILPDKYRVHLKGGTQLVGSVLDMDEFNLKLQTDDGVVNIDMPQIVNMETYDYDQGQEQQQFVQQKIEQEATARQAALAAAQQQATPAQTSGSTAGGLQFDEDIDRVFETKKPQVVNGSVITPDAAYTQHAQQTVKPLTDEEAFLKGVKTGSVSQQAYASAAKKELSSQKTAPKKETSKQTPESQTGKYFAVEIGAMPLDLKLDTSGRAGHGEGDSQDIGGTSVVASAKFLWRVADSNLWLGPAFSIANIANSSFDDLDPDVAAANTDAVTAGRDIPYPDPTVKTSGQILNLGATANYYLNPRGRVAFYLTASAGYEMLTLNYRGEMKSDSVKSNGFSFSGGIGAEMLVDDVLLGLEARQVFAARSGELKESSSSNTAVLARVSWKF